MYVYIQWYFHRLWKLKRGLVETLLHRNFKLPSNYQNFHLEIEALTLIFRHCNYQKKFVNLFLKSFLKNPLSSEILISCFQNRGFKAKDHFVNWKYFLVLSVQLTPRFTWKKIRSEINYCYTCSKSKITY